MPNRPPRRRRVPPPPPLEGEELVDFDDELDSDSRLPKFFWVLVGFGGMMLIGGTGWLIYSGVSLGGNLVLAYKTSNSGGIWTIETPEFEVRAPWYLSCDQNFEFVDIVDLRIVNVDTGEVTDLGNRSRVVYKHDESGRFKIRAGISGRFKVAIFQNRPIPLRKIPSSEWIADY